MVNGGFYFFFQAEDGIRDGRVTGVQTCALPILLMDEPAFPGCRLACRPIGIIEGEQGEKKNRERNDRSEERRVGKECRSRRSPYQYKKKRPYKNGTEKVYNYYGRIERMCIE